MTTNPANSSPQKSHFVLNQSVKQIITFYEKISNNQMLNVDNISN